MNDLHIFLCIDLYTPSNLKNTPWGEWSSCTEKCFGHNMAMPRRIRNRTTESGFTMREEGLCEKDITICPFGKSLTL